MLELLEVMSENVTSIKNNSDPIVFSMDELINVIVVSNKNTESNMLLIEHAISDLIDKDKSNIFDEVKKVTIGIATQKGFAKGYVFIFKGLDALSSR